MWNLIFTHGEEHVLRVSSNTVLRTIFGTKKGAFTEG
jgi:hypothetical protein